MRDLRSGTGSGRAAGRGLVTAGGAARIVLALAAALLRPGAGAAAPPRDAALLHEGAPAAVTVPAARGGLAGSTGSAGPSGATGPARTAVPAQAAEPAGTVGPAEAAEHGGTGGPAGAAGPAANAGRERTAETAATAGSGSPTPIAAAPGARTPALAGGAGSAEPPTVVRQPRDFGHVIGDVLTQRVLLRDGERALRLPPADRVGAWLERRTPRIETDADGRRWLAIDYQFVNAPRALTTTQLPALAIATAPEPGGREPLDAKGAMGGGPALTVPAWPVSVGPLSAATPSLDPAALRPDAPVRLPSTAALQRRLGASASVLALVLAAWLGWWCWRERRESVLPFARAERELRRLDPASAAAWQSLHRALNASAGRVVPAAGLARWLEERPDLDPLQPRLEDFFRRSARRFFDPDGAGADAACDLSGLCRALRRAERRRAR